MIFMAFFHIVACGAFFTFSWENVALMMALNFATGCIGITLSFHRLLTHRAFHVPKWFERVLATFGILALQGSPLEWVSHHRMHHAGSDTPTDPHNASQGFWYSHWGWLFRHEPEFDSPERMKKFARDIANDPYYQFFEPTWRQAAFQTLFGVLLLAVGGWEWVIWGIFVRLVVVYHSTWLVNSAAHIWGYTNYDSGDRSKNNWFVALLTWGEGWHNNHHAHGGVAEAGHKWWELDITMMVIRFLQFIGLATKIKSFKDHDEDGLTTPDVGVSGQSA